jgi:tetratricopeptide (TPR) repeat protein
VNAGDNAAASATNAGSNAPRVFPSGSYFLHIAMMHDGDYQKALDGFRSDFTFGLQAAGTHWVDSICYLTMAGECLNRMGRPAEALDDYNAALKLYLAFPNWMMGIQFPANIARRAPRRPTPWGQSERRTQFGQFPAAMFLIADTVLADPIPPPNGSSRFTAAGQPVLANVQEIARTTALALERRRELLGPVCPYDPLTAAVAALFARRPAGGNPGAQAWLDAEQGLAYLDKGQTADAIRLLNSAAAIGGELDHPLTPLVLLQLGQLSLEAGDFKAARGQLLEASYSAAEYGDNEVLEEAFRGALQAHLALHPAGKDAFFAPLEAATAWSKRGRQEVRATLLLLTADDAALLENVRPGASALSGIATAEAALTEARSVIGQHEMGSRAIGARLHFLSALVDYQRNKPAAADPELAVALKYAKDASPRRLQIRLADQFASSLSATPANRKLGIALHATLLRDPTAADWAADPLEAIAASTIYEPAACEHWFEQAREMDVDLSLEVADQIRRRRFFSTLPLGGRLVALRWLLESPPESMAAETRFQRQELFDRYPRYSELADRVAKLREELVAAPLAPVGAAAQKTLADKLAELARVAGEKESLLHEIALRRENATMLFPPVRKVHEVQAALLPRQLVLAFFSTHDGTYAWLLTKNRRAAWKIAGSPALLEQRTAALLRAIGSTGANQELSQNQLADEGWRTAGREAFDAITAGSKVNLAANIDELVIVPDGVLWYLPFEALPVGAAQNNDPSHDAAREASALLARSRIRYVPTLGLAMPEHQERRPLGEVGLESPSAPQGNSAELPAEWRRFARRSARVSPIKRPLPAASPLYGSLFDTLVVLDDVAGGEKSRSADPAAYFQWSPIPLDRTRGVGSLAQWLAPPRLGASCILLPEFHTPAENSLRQLGAAPPGADLFLASCGLMAGGARTVLLSRWRMGGQSTDQLMRQFAEELPHASAADAWQRSVQILWQTPLDSADEPRLEHFAGPDGATARHPLFWSGYVLIDTGWSPGNVEPAISDAQFAKGMSPAVP